MKTLISCYIIQKKNEYALVQVIITYIQSIFFQAPNY